MGAKKPNNTFVHDIEALVNPEWYSHSTSLDANNRTISTSGIIGQRKDGTFPATLPEQVPQVLSNVAEALQAAGASTNDIVPDTLLRRGLATLNGDGRYGPLVRVAQGREACDDTCTRCFVGVSRGKD